MTWAERQRVKAGIFDTPMEAMAPDPITGRMIPAHKAREIEATRKILVRREADALRERSKDCVRRFNQRFVT